MIMNPYTKQEALCIQGVSERKEQNVRNVRYKYVRMWTVQKYFRWFSQQIIVIAVCKSYSFRYCLVCQVKRGTSLFKVFPRQFSAGALVHPFDFAEIFLYKIALPVAG